MGIEYGNEGQEVTILESTQKGSVIIKDSETYYLDCSILLIRQAKQAAIDKN